MTDGIGIERGTQIAYIPRHAKGDINHPGVEFGFVTTKMSYGAFCRFWNKDGKSLRTTANSELVGEFSLLTIHISHPQEEIKNLLVEIERNW